MNIRQSTEHWNERKRRCSSIPTEARPTTEAENEAIRQKVAHRAAWMDSRIRQREREEVARRFFGE